MPRKLSQSYAFARRRRAVSALLLLGAVFSGTEAEAATREVHIGPRAQDGSIVICAEPRPAGGSSTADALRQGLFDVCEGYRAGAVSPEEYRATLAVYPAVVLHLAALEALDRLELTEARTVGGWLNANPALPALCRSLPAEQWLSAATASSSRLAALCLFSLNRSAKD